MFPSLNVQSKNIFKKTQFRTNEQLEYIAALPRTNKSITFHQQMLAFLANEEKRIKSNFKLKRYEIKKNLSYFELINNNHTGKKTEHQRTGK